MFDPDDMNALGTDSYPMRNGIGELHTYGRAGGNRDVDDTTQYSHYGKTSSARLVPMERLAETNELNGTLDQRAGGTYTMWPSRPWSAQTRIKNLQYELPAFSWTDSPEGFLWAMRVPAIPQYKNLNTMNDYSVQRPDMPVVTMLQAENQETWYTRIKRALFTTSTQNLAAPQAQPALQDIYPSLFNGAE